MYFFIHTQIQKDSSPIMSSSYNTMTEALSALYSGMAYDVASDAVLRSWAKVCTDSGQIMKEEEYVKVEFPVTTETDTTPDSKTPSEPASDASEDQTTVKTTNNASSDQTAVEATNDASGEQSTTGTPTTANADVNTES